MLCLTRYLYEKDDVKISLILSLLDKKIDECLFWAYELYHSGYILELIDLIWEIYYDFYACLNPKFEKYLFIKLKKNMKDDRIISMIINNLFIRPFNLDVFMLRSIVSTFEIEREKVEIIYLLETKNYIQIATYILDDMPLIKMNDVDKIVIEYFNNHCKVSILKKLSIALTRKILLSKIMMYYSLMNNMKNDKSVFVIIEPEDVVLYETIEVDLNNKVGKLCAVLPAYKILPLVCVYNIDCSKLLDLFELERDNIDFKNIYLNDWLYYASFSPIWYERIKKYNGIINREEKNIYFENDCDEECFYENYNYEPDEQSLEVQEKSIKVSKSNESWRTFYDKHKKNGLLDIDLELLDNMIKIRF
jgi:hypothetical protein